MYALVDGHMVLLGPIPFNHRMFNSVLESDLELDNRLTSSDVNRVPFNVTETVKVLFARKEYDPTFNPRYHEESGPTVQVFDNEVVFFYGIREKTLEQIKAQRKAEIPPYRREKENTEIALTVNGVEIKVPTNRENRLALASKAMGGEGPYNFKFSNNTWVEVTKGDIEYILQQIDTVIQEAFDWELAKNQEIDACQTADEVYNVVINNQPPILGEAANDINL